MKTNETAVETLKLGTRVTVEDLVSGRVFLTVITRIWDTGFTRWAMVMGCPDALLPLRPQVGAAYGFTRLVAVS